MVSTGFGQELMGWSQGLRQNSGEVRLEALVSLTQARILLARYLHAGIPKEKCPPHRGLTSWRGRVSVI